MNKCFLFKNLSKFVFATAWGIGSLYSIESRSAVGPRLGWGFSFPSVSVSGVTVPGLSTQSGLVAGLGFEYGFGPVGIVADALYTRRIVGLPADSKLTFSYIEIPVMAQVSLLGLRLGAGGYYGLGVGDLEACIGATCSSGPHSTAAFSVGGVSGNFNKNDMGLMLSAGYGLPIPMLTAAIDLRFRLGVSNIANVSTMNIKWRGVDIVAGVLF